ncbi:hypothetical protein ABBQ32_004406 [Trebouxia sp. C0010 RCD-2024]
MFMRGSRSPGRSIEDLAIGNTYFDPYTGEYDETYGDGILAPLPEINDCHITVNGTAAFNGTKACDLQIQGVDKVAPLLVGGMDGVYKMLTCKNGRPMYKRDTQDKKGERVLWYSSMHRDWDFTNGSTPKEDDILLWGGFAGKETRPQEVHEAWHLASDFMPDFNPAKSPEYAKVNITVGCVEGSKEEDSRPAPAEQKWKPLLTDTEQDEQYWAVINQGRQDMDASGGVNSGLIIIFVATGLGIVVGLPFLIAKRRGWHKGAGDKGMIAMFRETFFGKQGHSS